MYDVIINICFCAIYLLVPIFVISLLRLADISIGKFTIPSLFILFYFTFAYIGILPLYFGLDNYSMYLNIDNRIIIIKLMALSSISLLSVVIGFVWSYKIIGLNANIITIHKLDSANIKQVVIMSFIFMLCVIVLLIYLQQLESVALFKLLSGDIEGALVARSQMGNAFEGNYWRYQLFMRYLLDYVVMFFAADFFAKRTKVSMLFFLSSFFVAVFTSMMALEKGPLANLIIMIYLVYITFKDGKYWQKSTKYLLLIFMTVLVSIYIFSIGGMQENRTYTGLLFRIASRIFTGQLVPAYFYVDLFPDKIDYLLGRSMPNPGGLLPFENFPLTREVSDYIFPENRTLGISGTAPTVFWGEMYANFGPLAVILSSFPIGIGLFAVSHILTNKAISPPIQAALVTLAMHYKNLSVTSLSNYFVDTTLVTLLMVTFILIMFDKRHKSKYNVPSCSKDLVVNTSIK